MVLIGNECDKEKDRVISQSEAAALISGQPAKDLMKTSAKQNVNIIEISKLVNCKVKYALKYIALCLYIRKLYVVLLFSPLTRAFTIFHYRLVSSSLKINIGNTGNLEVRVVLVTCISNSDYF